MWKTITNVIWHSCACLLILERVVGLAGIPDDVQAWMEIRAMIPDELFGALVCGSLFLAWQSAWGRRQRERIRTAFGRATKMFMIGGAEYVPFTNLVDVVSEVDMTPLGPDGVTCGALPEGTNLVCFPNGTVQLASPTKAISFSAKAGTPKSHIQVSTEKIVVTDRSRNGEPE